MKKFLLKFTAILIVGIVVYLMCAFITWDFNPGNWHWAIKLFITITYVPFVYGVISE